MTQETEVTEVQTPLKEMFGVFIDIDIPTGRKSNLAEDLKLSKAPPEKLKISLGQKPTFNPDLVKALNTLRSQAHRACSAIGIRFMGGYAIPVAERKGVLDELEKIQKEFKAEAEGFFQVYPAAVQKWADEAGEYADAFRGAADSIDVVKAKTRCRVYTFPLGEAEAFNNEESESSTLVAQLFREVSVEAQQLWRDSFHTKSVSGAKTTLRTEATLAIVRPFDRIRSKLDGLSFIDPTVNVVVTRIDEVLASVRASGTPVQGAALNALQALCILLKDEQLIRQFAEGAADSAQDLFLAAPPATDPDESQPVALPLVVNGPAVVTTPVSASPVVDDQSQAVPVPVSAPAPTDLSAFTGW